MFSFEPISSRLICQAPLSGRCKCQKPFVFTTETQRHGGRLFPFFSLTLGRFGEPSGNCPIRFLFSRMSSRKSVRFRHRIVVTKNPRGFVIQSNKNPEIDATMESQVSKAAGPGAPGNIPALRFAIGRATRPYFRSCLDKLFATSHKTPASSGTKVTPCDNSFCG